MALIDNITELKKHNSSVSGDLELANIQSFIDEAINSLIIPVISRAQYDALIAGKSGYASDSLQTTLVLLLQKAVTGFAIAAYAVDGAVEISDAGIHVSKSEKRLPASDKKLIALRRQNTSAGYAALEMALIFMEGNKATFTQYAASEERKRNLSGYINTSLEFPQTIKVSPELYARIRAIQLQSEEDDITPIIGADVSEAIHTAIKAESLSEKQKELVSLIRKALAPITLAEAITYSLVSLDATGVYVFSDTVGGISGNVENRAPAELQRLQMTMYKLCEKGNRYKEQLRNWMNENATEFEGYLPSSGAFMADINKNVDGNIYFM